MSFDVYIEEGSRALRVLENWREVAARVAEVVRRVLPGARVCVFGSVVEGKYTAASDIDILVVADVDAETAARVRAAVYSEVDAPVELHIASPAQYERWYARFVEKCVDV